MTFLESIIIAGIALVGPVVAGVIAVKIANKQIYATQLRSFSDTRRERIEEAVQALVSLGSRLQDALPSWIEASQLAEAAKQESDNDALNRATVQLQSNSLMRKIPDDIIRIATLFELYMEQEEQKASRVVLENVQMIMRDPRARGQVDKSAFLLTNELLNEFSESTQSSIKLLLDAARVALRR